MVAQIDKEFVRIAPSKIYTRLLSYALYEGRPLTTKGRWFNWFVFKWLVAQSKFPWPSKVEKPVFILGTGRSGTTILGLTLGAHKSVGFLNEPKAIWSHIIPYEDVIGSYQDQVGKYRLSKEDIRPSMITKFHKLFGNYLKISGNLRLVDKYPELIFRIDAVLKIFPDAKFLFLFRNGEDTSHSIKSWSDRNNENDHQNTIDWWGKGNRKWDALCEEIVKHDDVLGESLSKISTYSDHVQMAAVEWIVTMKEGLKLTQDYPDQVKAVRYEDYVTDKNYRNMVLEFCELADCDNYSMYCDAVLNHRAREIKIDLPDEISGEFKRVMAELGYE